MEAYSGVGRLIRGGEAKLEGGGLFNDLWYAVVLQLEDIFPIAKVEVPATYMYPVTKSATS